LPRLNVRLPALVLEPALHEREGFFREICKLFVRYVVVLCRLIIHTWRGSVETALGADAKAGIVRSP